MKSFTVEEITQIVGGMLSKAESPEITHIAPPLLSDEKTFIVIENKIKSNINKVSTDIEVAQDELATYKNYIK